MQNIQECLTGLWPATGASSRRTARFAVSISAFLMAGLTTSVDMGKAIRKTDFLKKSWIFRALSRIFFQKLNMSEMSRISLDLPCSQNKVYGFEKKRVMSTVPL